MVGDAQRTRVTLSDKSASATAEVLRVDKARDVALLRLERIPDNYVITTLPLRGHWPEVGEDAYSIGTPLSRRKLQDTVSKGIISAHRRNVKFFGRRGNFLQADIDVYKGSEGAALLDEQGNITGIAAGSFEGETAHGAGLSYFIPIEEALAALDIALPR